MGSAILCTTHIHGDTFWFQFRNVANKSVNIQNPFLGLVALHTEECTQSCLSTFTACSERRRDREQKQKNYACHLHLKYWITITLINTISLFREDSLYQEVGGGGYDSTDLNRLSMTHPRTWTFPLQIGERDELFCKPTESGSWDQLPDLSLRVREHRGKRCTRHTLSAHMGLAWVAQPTGGKGAFG